MPDAFAYELNCAKSHMSLPLPVHTLKLLVHKHILSQVNIDTLMREAMLCRLKYACALWDSHTLNLFAYINIFRSVHISYQAFHCI